MFETRVDFTSHEYNCPINRTTVYIVLLYRAGFQPRFAYLVKYWDVSDILLFSCDHLPLGILRFTHTEYIFVHWSHADVTASEFKSSNINHVNPKIVWQDYQKELFVQNTFGMSYNQYMEDIIDKLLEFNDSVAVNDTSQQEVDFVISDSIDMIEVKEPFDRFNDVPNTDLTNFQSGCDSDINFSDKKLGYLAKQSTDFSFIDPDRQMVDVSTNIQQCISIAQHIKLTGKPNYMGARYPIKSGLNLEAWNRLLLDYPDKKLLQYLAFGLPLSLNEPEALENKVIKNHVSALQYP